MVLEFLRQCFLSLVKLITIPLIGFPCLCAGAIEKRSSTNLTSWGDFSLAVVGALRLFFSFYFDCLPFFTTFLYV